VENEKNKKYVAFLDLLGFSAHVAEDGPAAANILYNIRNVLYSHYYDPASKTYKTKGLQSLSKRTSVEDFESFLSMSDSIFIVGNNANAFIDQIASFLCNCFRYTYKNYYKPTGDLEHPENVEIKTYSYDGKPIEKTIQTKWYPTIFRGGICFGEVLNVPSLYISQKRGPSLSNRPHDKSDDWGIAMNLAGKGVAEAVHLEQEGSGSGPKIFISSTVEKALDKKRKYFISTDNKNRKHFLWPAYSITFENDLDTEWYEYKEFLLSTINLWKSCKGKSYANKYFEFVQLTIESFFAVCKYKNDNEHKWRSKIKKILTDEVNVSDIFKI